MPTALDTALTRAALDILDDVGISATWSVPSGMTYSTATGSHVPTTTVIYAVTVSPPLEYREGQIDGELVRVGDASIYIAASGIGFTPEAQQFVTISGQKWTVVRVVVLRSGEQVAAYKAQIRR